MTLHDSQISNSEELWEKKSMQEEQQKLCVKWQSMLSVSQHSDDSWSELMGSQRRLISTCVFLIALMIDIFRRERNLRQKFRRYTPWSLSMCFNERFLKHENGFVCLYRHTVVTILRFLHFSRRHSSVADQNWAKPRLENWLPRSWNSKPADVCTVIN